MSLQLVLLEWPKRIKPMGAYMLADLAEESNFVNAGHLQDVRLFDWSGGRVDLLIGCEVQETHRIMEHRFGDRQALLALQTALGLMLLGLSGKMGLVHYITARPESIQEQLNWLCNHGFGDVRGDGPSVLRMKLMNLQRAQRVEDSSRSIPVFIPVDSASRLD